MNQGGTSRALNLLFLGAYATPAGPESFRTFETESACILARVSAVVSASLSGLMIILVTTGAGIYRGMVPLALAYSFAFTVAAFWTWRMSRVAAISALLLYALMRHSSCGLVHMAVHLSVCAVYVLGIASTISVHKKHPIHAIKGKERSGS